MRRKPWSIGSYEYSFWRIEHLEGEWIGRGGSGRIKSLYSQVLRLLENSHSRQGLLFKDQAAIEQFLVADEVPASMRRYVAALRRLGKQAFVLTEDEMRMVFGKRSIPVMTSRNGRAATEVRDYTVLLDGPSGISNLWRVFSAKKPSSETFHWMRYLEEFAQLHDHRPTMLDSAEPINVQAAWRGGRVVINWPLGPPTSMHPSIIALVPGTGRTALLWAETHSKVKGNERAFRRKGRPIWFTGETTIIRFEPQRPPIPDKNHTPAPRDLVQRIMPLDVLAAGA